MDIKINIGRRLGVVRLTNMIQACENERQGETAFRILKFAIGAKGDRVGVLRFAREILTNVNEW